MRSTLARISVACHVVLNVHVIKYRTPLSDSQTSDCVGRKHPKFAVSTCTHDTHDTHDTYASQPFGNKATHQQRQIPNVATVSHRVAQDWTALDRAIVDRLRPAKSPMQKRGTTTSQPMTYLTIHRPLYCSPMWGPVSNAISRRSRLTN